MKYDLNLIRYINLFEKKTNTQIKDCFFEEELLIFVVMPGQVSKAVGKQGINIKQLSNLINKRLKVVEFSADPIIFIKSFIAPIEAEEIKLEENIILIKPKSTKDKGMLIGRDSKKINNLKKIAKKYYENIENIKIV